MPTAIEKLLEYHNKSFATEHYEEAEILIITCLDSRIDLQVPKKFAFTIRIAGANPKAVMPNIAFVVSRGIKSIAIIGHTDCAMSDETKVRETFSQGHHSVDLPSEKVEEYFKLNILPSVFSDLNENLKENKKYLKSKFPEINIQAMIYDTETHALNLVK
jgi:carbonic anhydrase